MLHSESGETDLALLHLKKALAIAIEVGDRLGVGICEGYLGSVYRARNEESLAASHFARALRVAQEHGDGRFEGVWMANLGCSLRAIGKREEARTHLLAAEEMLTETVGREENFQSLALLECMCELGHLESTVDGVRSRLQAAEAFAEVIDASPDEETLGMFRELREYLASFADTTC